MTRVVLLGDSHLARVEAPDLLAPEGVPVLKAAEGGAGAGDLIGQARGAGVRGDDVLVVSVGTNDAAPWKLLAIDDYTDALRDFLDEVRPSRLVLLVPPGVDEARLAGHADRTNRGVATYAERAASLFGAAGAHVLEAWALLAPLQQRAFVDDGVHLSDAGYDVLVPALREAIATAAG
jgi:lysophospholipase L1-like esterase